LKCDGLRSSDVEPDVAINERHAEQVAAPGIREVHLQKARARMPFDQADNVQRMRAGDDRRAEMHLHRHIALAGQTA
jgi:hypothetical protein